MGKRGRREGGGKEERGRRGEMRGRGEERESFKLTKLVLCMLEKVIHMYSVMTQNVATD